MPLFNISVFDLLNENEDELSGGDNGSFPPSGGVDSAVVGGCVGGGSFLLMVIVIAILIRKNLELANQILANIANICSVVQGTLTTVALFSRRKVERTHLPPTLPPRTYPRNLTDEELIYMRAENTTRPGGIPTHDYDYV